jgi:hypothetical protein
VTVLVELADQLRTDEPGSTDHYDLHNGFLSEVFMVRRASRDELLAGTEKILSALEVTGQWIYL